MSDCPVGRVVYGDRPCDGPGTYYCDGDLWHSACRRYYETRQICSCGEAWSGHPNPHALTCPAHRTATHDDEGTGR